MLTLLLAATQPADPPPAWLTFAIIGGFLIIFPLFWSFIVCLLSFVGGWHALSRKYAAGDRKPEGKHYGGLQGRIGFVNYKGVLSVHTTGEGFFLDVMPLFRPGHPRLFIPWSAVSDRRPGNILWLKVTILTIGQPAIATLSIALEDELLQPPQAP